VGIEAVTYDFWETIAREATESLLERRTAAWSELLRDSMVPPETVRRVFEETWRIHSEHWRSGEQFTPAMAVEHAVEDLDADISPQLRDELSDAFADAGATAELVVNDGLEETLDELKRRGVRTGIICDVGFTSGEHLRDVLRRAGILERFDGWAFSDEVGAYKPDPVIFRHALREIGGAEPERAAHIGDLRRTDIAGARAMGMVAIRYRGSNDDPPEDGPEGHHVLDDHAALGDLLRGAGLL
jgi:HAD superfamily hydrolase (TIGR01509 family)